MFRALALPRWLRHRARRENVGHIMRLLCTLAFSALATTAWAEGSEKALECAKIEDSLQRLNCFDHVFPKNAAAETPTKAAEQPVEAGWIFSEDKSPIDDSVRVTAGLIPKHVSYTGIGNCDAFLLFRCQENKTSVIISTSMFMSDEAVSVTTRLGDHKATTSRWSRSTDYKAVGLWDGGGAIPFIRSLASQDKLAVRIQARDKLDAEFELGNVAEAAQKIAGACSWKVEG